MESHFVTCIYNGLNSTKIGGRLNRDRPYKYSLSTIAKTKEKIICYTSPQELQHMRADFPLNNFSNVKLLPWDLYDMSFHNEVDIVRQSSPEIYRESPDWRDRCVEIMWGKFLFIKDSILHNAESEYVFWIDAGISHPGIIHSRFNPHYEHNIGFVRDLDKSTYHLTFQNDIIFNESFMKSLIDYTGEDKILNIAARGPQHPRLSHSTPFKGSVIGGIFGGRKDLMLQYCDLVISDFQMYLDDKKLCKEEQIMTEILNSDRMPIKLFIFDTWYHPDWGNSYKDTQISFCDFFDEIKK